MPDPPFGAPPAATSGPRSSLDRVLRAIEGQGLRTTNVRPHSFMAGCPVHEDRTPSLHVTWRQGQRGSGVLLYCHGCQAQGEQIAQALGLRLVDLFDDPLPERDRALGRVGKSPSRRRAAQRRGKLGRLPTPVTTLAGGPAGDVEHQWVQVERYPYVDPQGRLVQEVLREECTAEGTRHKQFRQVFLTGTGRRVQRKPQGFFPVLYRAPQVRAAVQAGAPVWLLEGEKDVHTAEALGVVATTNAQGGKSFPEDLVPELAGARVLVVLDRDATGWARGVDLHAKLTAVGATVALKLPALDQPKADLSDHVQAGHGLDELLDVCVEEVATWHALTAVRDTSALLARAIDEAQARWQLAEDGQNVQNNRRFARRWALEVQVRQEALRDLTDQVWAIGMRVGTDWAGQAMEAADRLLTDGTDRARRCHLDLGVPVPQSLRPTPPSASSAAPDTGGAPAAAADREGIASPAQAGTGDGDAWVGEQGVGASAPVFRVLDGRIVQWEPDRSPRRRHDDWEQEDEHPGTFKTLLSTVVRVTRREYREVEEDHDVERVELLGRASSGRQRVRVPRELVAVRVQFPDEVTGELMEVRVLADSWRDHSWLESLPGHPDYDHKRAGLDQLQRAILAISQDVVDEVIYRATGWRANPDGTHRYVHARGAIDAGGHHDLEVALSGPLERYDLPDPTRDAQRLRQAWLEASVTMVHRLPGRVSAPLLGQVFRAVLGHNPWVLTLVGPPGSYKTSVAAKAMHHFGERWEHTKPASSMSGNGDTFNALRFKLHGAKDALYWMDDFAPTKSWLEAQRHLEETARLVHNQEERSRASRDGLSISDGTSPRASGLCTSEVMPRPGSASERMFVVPLAREDVDPGLLFPLDEPLSRHGRALVMASYISWLAGDLKGKRARYLAVADAYAQDLITGAGETVRAAAAIAHTWIGWVAMTDFLLEQGAISAPERQATLTGVDASLREAGAAAVNPDMPRTTGARVRELLGYALGQGIAYVDDVRTGECPPWPLAGRLGWRRTAVDTDVTGQASKYRLERGGIRLGYVLHDPDARERGRVLMCDSTQLEAVLKAASATQAEKLEIDRATACRALHDEGVLIPDTCEGRTRHTVKCRIYAEDRYARMVTLHLDQVLGDEQGPPPGREPADPGPGTGGGPGAGTIEPGWGSGGGTGGQRAPELIPGLLLPGNPPEDTSPAAAQVDVSGSDHDEDAEGTDHPSEEPALIDIHPWTSRPVTDRDGVVGWTEQVAAEDVAPCVVCGIRCGVVISGVRAHYPCWEGTTATQRASSPPVGHPHARQQPAKTFTPEDTSTGPGQAPANDGAGAPLARAGAPPTASGSGFRAAAAVVDLDGIWLSNGEHLPVPGQGPAHVGDLVRLAQWLQLGTQTTKYRSAAGQVWVGQQLAHRLGIDVEAIEAAPEQDKDKVTREVTKSSPAVTAALDAGYSIGGRDGDSLGRWTRVWKGSEKSVWVVLLAAMPGNDPAVPLLRDHPDHATLARRIGLLADALGHPYQLSGSTTGLDLMMALRWKDRDTFFPAGDPCPPAQQSTIETDLNWCRKPTTEELKHEWVHAYDRSGSYLAGVSGLELGVGTPVHHPDGAPFTPRVPGYWRVEIPENGDWRMPNPLDPRGTNAGRTRWVTTPGLEFALEQGYDPPVVEAYTWSQHARILDPWYERIRDARTALDVGDGDAQVARDQLKAIYAPTIGMLGSQTHMTGRTGYAPERRHLIIAKARTNILRRVAKIGEETDRWPVAIVADTVLYTSPEADPVVAWPGGERWMGRELGRYKAEGSARLETQLEFLTGGPYKGKDAIAGRVRGAE